MSDQEASLAESQTVIGGKYRLLRVLGQGGMGTVYEARHEVIGQRFAIKFMHPELAERPEVLARFKREAQAAGALENENIAAVTDFGVAEDGAPYIVMEFLQGEDVAGLLTRLGALPVPRAVYAIIQACRGLEAAHAQGIIHRDLKPENLFVTKRGDGSDLIKVLDFGIAKLRVGGDSASSTRTGMTLGTPYYMPPEQARGQKDIDQRADIYALGVILYELLSGQKPHNGDGYNAIMYQILTQAPTRIETLRPNLPQGLADVVHKAMAFEPNDRFQRASEFASVLAPFAGRAITPVDSGERPAFLAASRATDLQTALTPPDLEATVYSPAVTSNASGRSGTPVTQPAKSPKRTRLWLLAGVVLLVSGAAAKFLYRPAAAEPEFLFIPWNRLSRKRGQIQPSPHPRPHSGDGNHDCVRAPALSGRPLNTQASPTGTASAVSTATTYPVSRAKHPSPSANARPAQKKQPDPYAP